jgi:hypothetical protein
VIELAVIPAAAIRFGQMQDRDTLALGEAIHVATEPVADVGDHRRRGDGLTQMVAEPVDLPAHLQIGDVGVEIETIHALNVQPHMPVKNLVDIHHAGHAKSCAHEGRLCRPDKLDSPQGRVRGRPGGGLVPRPLIDPRGNYTVPGPDRSGFWRPRP